MCSRVLVAALVLAFSAEIAPAAEFPPGTALQLRQLEERTAKLSVDKPSEYAKGSITAAQASIAAARSAIATENELAALQNLEAANLQLNLAEMKVIEKELADEITVRKEELKKLEAQLERYLQGEDK